MGWPNNAVQAVAAAAARAMMLIVTSRILHGHLHDLDADWQ
jgi:hypothetical protein